MHWARRKRLKRLALEKLKYSAAVLAFGGVLAGIYASALSHENSFDRVQGGEWVTASMYWEDKLDASGNKFDPIGWHAAHKTLPIGTLIRVSNPKNHRSINVTITDRGPFVPGRDLDLTLGAGTLLGFKGLGQLYMEVLSYGPTKDIQRPVLESLFTPADSPPVIAYSARSASR